MKEREILSVKSEDTGLVIVQDDLYIGSPSDDSQETCVVIGWKEGVLHIDKYPLTDAMIKILQMYIDKEL